MALVQTGVLAAALQKDDQMVLIFSRSSPGSYFSVIQVRDGGVWNQGSGRQMDQHIESDREKPSVAGEV